MAHFTVSDNHIVNNLSEYDASLKFQTDDFDSVWGSLSLDSLSDDEQILFQEPENSIHENIGLWKDLEPLQPVFKQSKNMNTISRIDDSGNESGDKFDHIFNQGIINSREDIKNDPMMSSSFELATPQHPFEEDLLLPEDPTEDTLYIHSPRSTVYYPSSAEDEEVENNVSAKTITGASKIDNSPPPHGYPNSIHSYSQPSVDINIDSDGCNDMEEDELKSNKVNETVTVHKYDNRHLNVKNVSPFKAKNRRRQRKSRVFTLTISEPVKNSPKRKTFSNGKAKLYAVKPLANPAAEKARLNAINAKKNRDLKKKEKDIMAKEVVSLREENGTLRKSAAAMRRRAAEAEAELRRLRAAITANQLEDIIKAAGKKQKDSDVDITNISDTDVELLW